MKKQFGLKLISTVLLSIFFTTFLVPPLFASSLIGVPCKKASLKTVSAGKNLSCETRGKKLIWIPLLKKPAKVAPTPTPTPTPTLSPVSTPLPQDFNVHDAISAALKNYSLVYTDPNGQATVEASIHDQETYNYAIDNLVTSAKSLYPGFASQISRTNTLTAAIKPWADMLAKIRNLASNAFEAPHEGFMQALENSTANVDQNVFNSLEQRYVNLNQTFNQIDSEYWINEASDPKFIYLVFEHRDSFLGDTDTQAVNSYRAWAISLAEQSYKPYAFLIEQGETMDQAGIFWVNRFTQDLGIATAAVNPRNESIILTAVSTQDYTTWQFDTAVRQDPRWLNSSAAINTSAAIASQILCAFGLATCSK